MQRITLSRPVKNWWPITSIQRLWSYPTLRLPVKQNAITNFATFEIQRSPVMLHAHNILWISPNKRSNHDLALQLQVISFAVFSFIYIT